MKTFNYIYYYLDRRKTCPTLSGSAIQCLHKPLTLRFIVIGFTADNSNRICDVSKGLLDSSWEISGTHSPNPVCGAGFRFVDDNGLVLTARQSETSPRRVSGMSGSNKTITYPFGRGVPIWSHVKRRIQIPRPGRQCILLQAIYSWLAEH